MPLNPSVTAISVVDSARLQVIKDVHPELSTLRELDLKPQDIACAIGQYVHRPVDGLVAH